ncbi:MAG TPA: (2Fe-2S)-binding protein [Mycobacteriales bacterium]|jgi:bacterioferritin-associated ferredoxin|nr:(2Fe-2S)-binding protein [Mycobacteriales bacterium]
MFACLCFAVTDEELDAAIDAGARTEEQVGDTCGAGTGCGSCLDRICARLVRAEPEHGRIPLRVAGRGQRPPDRRCRAG